MPRPRPLHPLALGALACLSATPAAPASDDCATATVLTVPGAASGSTAAYTNDGAASCGQSADSPDAWFRFTTTATGPIRIDTCGSGYDSVLSVHTACPDVGGAELACNDDLCALNSTVVIDAVAGATYLARVSGFNGASGPFMIAATPITPEPLDACALAQDVGVGSYAGSTIAATNDGAASCGQSAATADHWYRFTATAPGVLRADTCGSDYDTVLSLHTACPGDGGQQLACNDDACALHSVVQALALPGQPVYIRVSGFNGARGEYALNLSLTPAEIAPDCAQAVELADGSVVGTTAQGVADDAPACAAANVADVWYRYTAQAPCNLELSTCDSLAPVGLAVYRDACPASGGAPVACIAAGCAPESPLVIPVDTGETYLVRVWSDPAAAGPFVLTARCRTSGADILMGDSGVFAQFGRLGDTVGCAIDTPVCNAGDTPLDWYANPDPRHPFQVFNMYRLMDGRLEQIGMSWVKHGFAAAQGNACGLGCEPNPNSLRLGVGCSDTYGAGLNAQQNLLGPRHEINPWTGAFTYAASHLADPDAPAHTEISHRLQLRDADLDPALNPGAQYLAEVYVLAHDDANHMNSITHEPVGVAGAPGGTWTFNMSMAPSAIGPAINAWPGASRTTILTPGGADGRCIVAAKVTDNGDGTWRYEYAVYNHDLDRAVRAFTVPLRPSITVTGAGFSAARSHDEPFSNAPWTASILGGAVTWSTAPPNGPTLANPIRWGTIYNFWFDADAPPVDSLATLRLYAPAPLMQLRGAAPAPAAPCAADVDLDGLVTSGDISAYLSLWLASITGGVLDADVDADGAVTSADISAFLTAWLGAVGGGC